MRYEQATDGIRVRVRPRFSLADSDPEAGTFTLSETASAGNSEGGDGGGDGGY